MNGKLRDHLDTLFSEAPNNQKTVEIKEEILQNLCAKYNDLISQGKSEEAAYNIAIAGIGDISGLVKELKENADKRSSDACGQDWGNYRRRSAFVAAIAVMMYILSAVPVIVLGNTFGLALLFVIVAGATGLLVYNNFSKPGRQEGNETMVEEFRKWCEASSKKGTMMRAISSAIWSITVALYFLISFVTGAWYITWVIFLIAGAVNNVVKAAFDLKE
jgi:hypothetical protein